MAPSSTWPSASFSRATPPAPRRRSGTCESRPRSGRARRRTNPFPPPWPWPWEGPGLLDGEAVAAAAGDADGVGQRTALTSSDKAGWDFKSAAKRYDSGLADLPTSVMEQAGRETAARDRGGPAHRCSASRLRMTPGVSTRCSRGRRLQRRRAACRTVPCRRREPRRSSAPVQGEAVAAALGDADHDGQRIDQGLADLVQQGFVGPHIVGETFDFGLAHEMTPGRDHRGECHAHRRNSSSLSPGAGFAWSERRRAKSLPPPEMEPAGDRLARTLEPGRNTLARRLNAVDHRIERRGEAAARNMIEVLVGQRLAGGTGLGLNEVLGFVEREVIAPVLGDADNSGRSIRRVLADLFLQQFVGSQIVGETLDFGVGSSSAPG